MGTRVTAQVSSGGRITLPKAVRDELDLKLGSTVFEVGRRQAMLRPVVSFLDLFGTVKPRKRPEDFAEMRRLTAEAVGREVIREGGVGRTQAGR